MKCLKCGFENQPDSRFCLKCGELLALDESNSSLGNVSSGNNGSGLAIASMVCGIIGLVVCIVPIVQAISFILDVLSIIFGLISLVKKREGKGMAIAGVVCGGIALVLYLLVIGAAYSGASKFI
ncbi:DUF4190 domain-containing protein [bacterium D16-51]|nr:DUF4190 domain-containing protein [bacterium D16-59]RKI54941.1 DUF4190 domain-containing protein [bacterium D16-51]